MKNSRHTYTTDRPTLSLFQLAYIFKTHPERHYHEIYNDVMCLPRELDNEHLIPRKEQALILFAY